MLYSAAGAGTQGVILGSSVSLNATSSPTSTSQVHVTSRTLYLIWMRNGLGCEFCLLPPHPSFDRIKIQNVSELENGKNVAYFSLELGRCFNVDKHVREEPKVPPPPTSPASWVSSLARIWRVGLKFVDVKPLFHSLKGSISSVLRGTKL